jgi:hypothetical protein
MNPRVMGARMTDVGRARGHARTEFTSPAIYPIP